MEAVSVSALRTANIWKFTARGMRAHLVAQSFRVIVPDRDLRAFARISGKGIQVEPESTYSKEFKDYLWAAISGLNPGRYGWYLQQLIKLEALRLLGLKGTRGLIWDADTVPLRPLTFFNGDQVSFYWGEEYHPPYFETVEVIGVWTICRTFVHRTVLSV